MSSQIIVKSATSNDLDAIARLRAEGFGGTQTEVRAHIENHPRYGLKDFLLAEIAGETVGTALAFQTQMWLSGVPVQMGAVASVTTDPAYRNKGVFRAMMPELLTKMAAEGVAISSLFPAAHSLYEQFGYATAATWHAYSIEPDNLPNYAEAGRVRPFEMDDLPTIRSIYRGNELSQADGRLTRTNTWWERIVGEKARSGGKHIVVYDDDGVEGYLKYAISKENILKVSEMFVLTDEAYRRLWSYMAAQPDIASVDYLAPANDPILHMLKVPRDRHGGNRGWIFDDIYHATASFMIRIIDLTEALTSRFYPHNMMGNQIIKLTDTLLPQNEKSVKFRIVDGRPDTLPVENEAPSIESDIGTFSQIFCGFLSPETARRLGKLKANDDSVAWLGKAMATKPLYIHSSDWF